MPGVPPHIKRRRAGALLALGVALAGIVVAVLALRGGDGPQAAGAGATTAQQGAAERQARRAARRADPTAGRDMGAPGPPRPVPILMYHVTAAPPPEAPFPDLYVPAEEFRAQMDALAAAGYVAVTQGEVWAAWHDGGPLPDKPVVVSIDDGYRSNFLNARPALREHGWPGVLNLKVGNLSEPEYGLTDRQVKALIADGWEINSHTIDHPDLTTVDAAQLTREAARSRAELRRRFGVPVDFFCYPAGRYDARVVAAVERAGYRGATTVEPGLARPDASPFELSRVRVDGGVSGAALVSRLEGLG